MEPNRTISELIQDVGDWSKLNFADKQAPLLGIVEEVGEACHCILKNIQGIRGYDDAGKFHSELQDAMADAMIYLCNFAYNHNAFFSFKRNEIYIPRPSDREGGIIVSHVLQAIAAMFNQENRSTENAEQESSIYSVFCQRFCLAMEVWAAMYYIDLEVVTFTTWSETVLKRDWKKNAIQG